MNDGDFVSIVTKSLEYHSSIALLVLGAYGFAVGRIWPEQGWPDRQQLFRLIPGFVIAGLVLLRIGLEYTRLGAAISGRSITDYATQWPSHVWIDELLTAAAVCWLFVILGLPRRTE